MPEFAALLRLASDQRLAEHVAAGSERAFEVLYDRHHRPVLSFCRHMLGSREEAEDAVQHTFMAAYRDLIRSGPHAAVRPWLFVIARNRCISILRARREHPAESLPELCTDHLASEVVAREELRAVLAGVARLPDDQRAALVLAELGDVSHDEIARILDCRREQVKSYVYLARASLLADRAARETSCADIREQLSELRGAQLRRAPLRRHLHSCEGCRDFREALRGQRRALGLLLPVAPSVGLKQAVLSAIVGGGTSAGGLTLGGVAVTALVVIAIPAGGVAAARGSEPPPIEPATRTSVVASPVPARAATTREDRSRSAPARHRATSRPTAGRRRDRPTTSAGSSEAKPSPGSTAAPADESIAQAAPKTAPSYGKPEPAPPEDKPKSAPDQDQPKPSPGHGKPPSAPGQSKPKTPPGLDKPKTPPGLDKPDAAPGKPDNAPGPPAAAPTQGPPADADPPPEPPRHANVTGPPAARWPQEDPGRSGEAPGRGGG